MPAEVAPDGLVAIHRQKLPNNLHRDRLAAAEPGGEAPPINPQQFPRGLQQVIDTAEHRNDGTLFGHGPSLVATS